MFRRINYHNIDGARVGFVTFGRGDGGNLFVDGFSFTGITQFFPCKADFGLKGFPRVGGFSKELFGGEKTPKTNETRCALLTGEK